MKIWTVTSCIPDERDPCIPSVFLSEADALAYLDEVMRGEWETNAPHDDETGEEMTYPDDWQEAHDLMADNDPDESWGKWLLSEHDCADPVRDAAPEMLEALRLADERVEMNNYNGEEDSALATIRAAIAKAEGRT